jgi:putative flippase GtrA
MDVTPRGVVALAKSPGGRRLLKYTAVSGVSVVISEIALIIALHYFHTTWANVIAVAAGTIPSYELNRKWAWGKRGKSHLWKEVVPFWAMSFLGLVVSTVAVDVVSAEYLTGDQARTVGQKALILFTNLAAFGVLWVAKFVVINKLLFAHQPEQLADELTTV